MGKMARALAVKLAIAAMDGAFTGNFIAPGLRIISMKRIQESRRCMPSRPKKPEAKQTKLHDKLKRKPQKKQ